MGKGFLTVLSMLAISFAANAKTYMHISLTNEVVDDYVTDSLSKLSLEDQDSTLKLESKNGSIIEYPTDSVELIMFCEESNGHEFVDLGLSVFWGTMNVGAESPEASGNEYQWGKLNPYEGGDMGGAYVSDSILEVDYDIAGTKHDVARAEWGEQWQMPTLDEWNELLNNCTFIWKTYNNVEGVVAKSNINGNWIFLPACGSNINIRWYYRLTKNIEASFASYWSSTPYIDGHLFDRPSIYSYCFYMNNAEEDSFEVKTGFRDNDDMFVRPVLSKKKSKQNWEMTK